MFTFILFFTISFIITKKSSDNKRQQKREHRRIQQEKEEVIQFVQETLYHNQLTSIHHASYHNGEHILQIQYQAQYYRVWIEKLIGVDEFTYKIKELPNHQDITND